MIQNPSLNKLIMEKYFIDEHSRLKYELVGDYYLLAGNDEQMAWVKHMNNIQSCVVEIVNHYLIYV